MAASTDVLIGNQETEHVLVSPVSRSHPGLFDRWDGNWIDCEIQAAVGAFHGTFRAHLRSDEFRTLLQELELLRLDLDATARLTTTDGQIALLFAGDGKGQIRVSGEAVDAVGTGNRLQFAFEIAQASLPPICGSLESLLAAYPVVGAPAV